MERDDIDKMLGVLTRATYDLADKQTQATTQLVNAFVTTQVVLIEQLAKAGALEKPKVADALLERLDTTADDLRGVLYDVVLRGIAAALTGGRITPDLSQVPEWLRAKLDRPKK